MIYLSPFKYKRLRKSNYKCDCCGASINTDEVSIKSTIDNDILHHTINDVYMEKYKTLPKPHVRSEIIHFFFDRKWEDYTYSSCGCTMQPSISSEEIRSSIATVIDNLSTPLGARTDYIDKYDKSLLYPVKREGTRSNIGYDTSSDMPFLGVDVWNAYEFSTLDEKGKPVNKLLRIIYPADSTSIIESKSLKLYFNSFNNCYVENCLEVISRDLKEAISASYVDVIEMDTTNSTINTIDKNIEGYYLIDDLDVTDFKYEYDKQLLKVTEASEDDKGKSVALLSYLLKSNCRHSGLPDWGSVIIIYRIDKYKLKEESLLKYIVSFRNHKEFHEECCERIFFDLFNILETKNLAVQLQYTRRGGIDINPLRLLLDDSELTTDVLRKESVEFQRDFRQ